MDSRDGRSLYQCTDTALVRATQHAELALPPWPDLTAATAVHVLRWQAWLRELWAVDAVAEAIEHASPALASEVVRICSARCPDARKAHRTVLSVARYVLRMTGRATPFGLFAGVAPASFGPELTVRWGGDHRAVGRPGASWLAEVIAQLESCPELVERLPVMINNCCFLRGGRLIVPYQPRSQGDGRTGAVEISIRHTAAVRLVVEAARTPIRFEELAGKLAAEFPTAVPSRVGGLLAELMKRGVLISSLHAPSTITDAYGHLLEQLKSAGADGIPQVAGVLHRLRKIDQDLARHNRSATANVGRGTRAAVIDQLATINATAAQPLAVDLRLDCTLVLPRQVAREAEAAASMLARLTAYPLGTVAWQKYHTRFFERHGVGALVPVVDLVNPDVGLGFPDGYAGAAPEPRTPVTARDERLLALAQASVLDGRDEIVLDDRLVAALQTDDLGRAQMPPHIEVNFQVQAASEVALRRGEFDLTVIGVSRGVGTATGRFVGLLEPADQQRLAATFATLPVSDPGTLPVQLSFPPLARSAAHVTRAPELLPAVVSLAEHRPPGSPAIGLDDLAVGCDGRRLYLASLTMGRRLEPTNLHALDLRRHTPPLARFLAEIGRAQATVVTAFDWGTAIGLPFLPRVRYGRTILSPARWLIDAAELPDGSLSWPQWREALTAWRARRRLPDLVCLTDRDRRLKLDLDDAGHLALLRAHLDRAGHAVLTEAPGRGAHGWFGGHAHEIVVPLVATRPARWPTVPPVTAARITGRDHGHLPGTSRWSYAKLYGHPDRVPEILAEYLPELLSQWEQPPLWWFIRYRDPHWHLRLRIKLPSVHEFGLAASRVSTWTSCLRHLGLLNDVQYAAYYAESGRWGGGTAMTAAEEVFAADSRALVAQFTQSPRPHSQALAAAHFVAIAAAWTGSAQEGMAWLIEHANPETSISSPRRVVDEAVRLADPAGDWAALRAAPGGEAIVAGWEPRHQALADYRALLEAADGTDADTVLVALLHAHHIRAAGIDREDEHACLRLARAAALSWTARSGRPQE